MRREAGKLKGGSRVSCQSPESLSLFRLVAAMRPDRPERKNEVKCLEEGTYGLRASTTCPPLTLFYICPATSPFLSTPTVLYNPWDQLISYTSLQLSPTVLFPQVMSLPPLCYDLFYCKVDRKSRRLESSNSYVAVTVGTV